MKKWIRVLTVVFALVLCVATFVACEQAPTEYTVTATSSAGGTLTADAATVGKGKSVVLTVAPDTGYELDTLTVGGESVTVSGTTYTVQGVTANVVAHATFRKLTFAVTATGGNGGTLTADKTTAEYGSDVVLTIAPDEGYELDTLTVNGESVTVSGTTYTVQSVTAAVTAQATFRRLAFLVTVTSGNGGTLSADKETAEPDTDVVLTVAPDTGYELDTLTVGGESVTVSGTTYTVQGVEANVVAHATFRKLTFAVTATGGNGGALTADKTTAEYGTDVVLTVAPDTGYELDTLTVNGESVTVSGTTYTVQSVTAAVTAQATFRKLTFPVTVENVENGTVTANKETVEYGGTVTFTVEAAAGYQLDSFTVNGKTEQVEDGTFTVANVTGELTVGASFAVITFSVSTQGDSNGSLNQSVEHVSYGGSVTFTAVPNEGYEVDTFTVNSSAVEMTDNAYTLENVTGNVVATVTFRKLTFTYTVDGVRQPEILYGDILDAPTPAERKGNPFVAWMNGDEEFDFEQPVKGNVSLTSRYAFEGDGTEQSPFLVTADTYELFAEQVNTGACTYLGMYVKLAENASTTTVIGNRINGEDVAAEVVTVWQGTFDGNGKTVTINNTEYMPFGGVFSKNFGTIKNLIVEGAVGTGNFCGGVVGWNMGTVTGCENKASVTATRDSGGIVGQNAKDQMTATIKDCINRGTVTLTGTNGDVKTATQAGGIVGIAFGAAIEDCDNYGKITNAAGATGNMLIGGIVGNSGVNIIRCENHGVVEAYGNCVGGIAGSAAGAQGGTVTDCINTAPVSGTSYVGGIVGWGKNTSTTHYYARCTNSGAVTATSSYVGGIVGGYGTSSTSNKTIEACHNTAMVQGLSYVGGIAGHAIEADLIKDCTNAGEIKATSATGGNPGVCVGGIVGWARGEEKQNGVPLQIVNCVNTGDVTAVNTTGWSSAAGIIGYCRNVKISGCSNGEKDAEKQPTITGYHYVAGILAIASVDNSAPMTVIEQCADYGNSSFTGNGPQESLSYMAAYDKSGTNVSIGEGNVFAGKINGAAVA